MAEAKEAADGKSTKGMLGSNGAVAELRALAANASSPNDKKSQAKKTADGTKRRTATGTADKRGKPESRTGTATATSRKVWRYSLSILYMCANKVIRLLRQMALMLHVLRLRVALVALLPSPPPRPQRRQQLQSKKIWWMTKSKAWFVIISQLH